jgi:spore coat polysaccharide biosynthesis protein SpsF
MGQTKTAQEEFWAGDFGNEYIERCGDLDTIPSRLNIFSKLLQRAENVQSVLELGPNVGLNLITLKQLLPNAAFNAVEINEKAYGILKQKEWLNVQNKSLLDSEISIKADLTFTAGVLIHINPDMLDKAYDTLYRNSNRYVAVLEYYNPTPVTVPYRGHDDKLFKRDFAGELMEKYPDLHLVDYGFVYNKDHNFPLDDTNWFLMEKR